MPLTVVSTCCLCGAAGTSQAMDIESMQLRPDPGWAMLRVEMAEAVLPKSMEGVAAALDNISNNPAYGIMAAQIQSMARPFSTNMLICGACQDNSPLWLKVQERLKAAIEKEVENTPPPVSSAVLSFPGSPMLRQAPPSDLEYAKCSVCGTKTSFFCSDCAIDTGGSIAVCSESKCQEFHDLTFHAAGA